MVAKSKMTMSAPELRERYGLSVDRIQRLLDVLESRRRLVIRYGRYRLIRTKDLLKFEQFLREQGIEVAQAPLPSEGGGKR